MILSRFKLNPSAYAVKAQQYLVSLLLFSLLSLGLSACGMMDKKPEKAENFKAGSVQALAKEAKDELESGAYKTAIELNEKIMNQDALSIYGQQALIDTAYAQWQSREVPLALVNLDRYMKQFPKSAGAAYVLYMKGRILYNERNGIGAAISKQDLSDRDPKTLRESYEAFEKLIKEYPDSKYAADGQARLAFIAESLAKHELGIAKHYLFKNAPLAAVNRAQNIMRDYPVSPVQEEALGLMVEAYRVMGMEELRIGSERVLAKNYPDSKYLKSGQFKPETKSFFALW